MTDKVDFGKIEYIQKRDARHIKARIKATGLIVTLPDGYSPQDAYQFLLSKKQVILAKQKKLAGIEAKMGFSLTEGQSLQTLSFRIELVRVARKDIHFSLKEGVLTIEFPVGADLKLPASQKLCWNGINYFLRKEAKRLLPARTSQLAEKYGFRFKDVKIQSGKGRWGSCSSAGSINYSLYLMLLPPHLVDYVILHELCHTREMNHSDAFWAEMDKVTDKMSKKLRAEVKKYTMPDVS